MSTDRLVIVSNLLVSTTVLICFIKWREYFFLCPFPEWGYGSQGNGFTHFMGQKMMCNTLAIY